MQQNDPYGVYLVPSRDWELEAAPQPAQPLTFFGLSRGICRFGLLASGSLSVTLLVRLLPQLMPGYTLVLVAGLAVTAVFCTLSRQTGVRQAALLIAITIALGAIGGWWDAVYSLFESGDSLFWQCAIVVGVLVLVVVFDALLRRGGDK